MEKTPYPLDLLTSLIKFNYFFYLIKKMQEDSAANDPFILEYREEL